MKNFSLKIGGIKEMLNKDQMKKITGGYNGCENPYYGGKTYCEQWGYPSDGSWQIGHYVECYSPECGSYALCLAHPGSC